MCHFLHTLGSADSRAWIWETTTTNIYFRFLRMSFESLVVSGRANPTTWRTTGFFHFGWNERVKISSNSPDYTRPVLAIKDEISNTSNKDWKNDITTINSETIFN